MTKSHHSYLSLGLVGVCLIAGADNGRAQSPGSGTVKDDSGNPPPNSVVIVRYVPELPKHTPMDRHLIAGSNQAPLEQVTKIGPSANAFSFVNLPDGKYNICVYPEVSGFVSNCEFSKPGESHFTLYRSIPNRPANLLLRRGTVVELAVSDPRKLISTTNGFHFRPSIISTEGQLKQFTLITRVGDQTLYEVTIPLGAAARLLFDTRLRVLDVGGQPIEQLMPSPLVVRGGSERVRVSVQVTTTDLDLRPVRAGK